MMEDDPDLCEGMTWGEEVSGIGYPIRNGESVEFTTTFVTLDSGQRQEFPTGSRRDTREGKGRYDLLPPEAIRRLAQVYERGAIKYGDRNWEKGQPVSRYLDSALRHIFSLIEGERTEDHAAQAAWNLLSYMTTEDRVNGGTLPSELRDLPWMERA